MKDKSGKELQRKAENALQKLFQIFEGKTKPYRIRKPFGQGGLSITGLSEGLGEFFETNPWFFRLGFVLGTFFSKWIILLYALLSIAIPEKGSLPPTPFKSRPKKADPVEEEWADSDFAVCENCQTAVKYGSKFCHNCGHEIS
ncbi:MAG: PspC domain-containing protein [Bacteroidota bacterium]